MRKIKTLVALLATGLVFGGALTAVTAPVSAEPTNSSLIVSIAEVDLEGPAISDIVVTLKNTSTTAMSDITVAVTGPINWTLYPQTHVLADSLAAGATATVKSEIHVPANPTDPVTRSFSATARYSGGDGAKTSFAERNQFTGPIPANLAATFNNVGTTSLGTAASGNYDGEKNSFSRERLAEKGITPGATINAAGTTFTWPNAEPGKPDNVTADGQTFKFPGQGGKIAFLGSGVAQGAVGEAVVHYSDGTSDRGTFGFPNWGFDPATAHGASLVVTTKGRNTPAGYANAEYDYRVFSNTIAIDPAKTVTMVTLPRNGGIHIFAIAFVPGAAPTTPPPATATASNNPTVTPSATTVPPTTQAPTLPPVTTAPPATTDPSVAPSTSASAEPSTTPSTEPGVDPSTTPSTEPGTEPGVDPGVDPTGAAGAVTGATTTAAITPAAADDDLANTGSNAAPLLGLAALLLVGGCVTTLARRQRRASHR